MAEKSFYEYFFRGDSKTSLLRCVCYHGGGYITRLYSMFSHVSCTYI